MKFLKSANEVLAEVRAGAEEARDAIELQTAVLLLVGIGVIISIGVGVSALLSERAFRSTND